MIGKVTVRFVPNHEISWAGGYPCGITSTGTVHAIASDLVSSRFVCSRRPAGEFKWTKKRLSCKHCKAAIARERRT